MRQRALYTALGLTFTVIFVWLTLREADLRTVIKALAAANPSWIAWSVLVYAGNLLLRSWRWQLILKHVTTLSFRPVLAALLVGYGVNSIIPARLGEIFRAEYFKQRCGLSRVWGLASILIERLLDGTIVVVCLGVGLLISQASSNSRGVFVGVLVSAASIFAAAIVVTVVLAAPTLPTRFAKWPRLAGQLEMLQRGLEIVRSRRFPMAIAVSLLVYVPDTLSLWLMVKALGVTLGFGDSLILVGMASLSTLLPSGPGFLGTLQFAYAITMKLIGVSSVVGIAAATLVQLLLLFPVALVGGAVLAVGSGISLRRAVLDRRHGV